MKMIKIREMDEQQLKELSKKMLLSLNLEEMKSIHDYYQKKHKNINQIELETIAQTWSEHCKHKTFSATINYTENDKIYKIKGLFKSYIQKPTIESNKDWLVKVFNDNAGIIKFNDEFNIAVKAETHNHPSALDPFGGANTGVGGVVRDILGVGLGAKPIANTDVFCFAPPDYDKEIPESIMHPKRIFKGVRDGVMDYGNKIGVPTVNGSIFFDDRYLGNPLVYCGTIGLIPKGMENKKAHVGDAIVVVGGRTGRDGIHGATFSSAELDETALSSAVQIGNPIEEKKMIDAILKARDLGLYNAITDCGAGGFSSAIGEMAEDSGAKVWLDKAPLKYKGLEPWEIWISESQERMVLSMPEQNFEKLQEICKLEGTEATIIGEITDTKNLQLYYNNEIIGELEMRFLHRGLPSKEIEAEWSSREEKEIQFPEPENYSEQLKQVLAMPNIASKEKTVRKYDHEVMGGTVGKPFVGEKEDGPADSAIIRPILNDWKGVIVANGINPFYSDIDPYWMACSAIDEAIRNIICSGGNIENTALLDNFSWGNPEKKETMGGLVRACKGCHDASKEFGTPFISGKDSLYNEYSYKDKNISIPGTLLITAVSVMQDIRKKITMPLKNQGNIIYIVGKTKLELGCSAYSKLKKSENGQVPKVDFGKAKRQYTALSKVMQEPGIIVSCHDCSDGGLGVAIAEMCFSGGKGAEIFLKKVPGENISRNDFILFSESNSRLILEVNSKNKNLFEKQMSGIDIAEIGYVTSGNSLIINGISGKQIIDEPLEELKKHWKKTLWW